MSEDDPTRALPDGRASSPPSPPPQPTLGPGDRLERYLIVDELGAGGMGVVYRAYDERLDRVVALKVLRSSSVDADEGRQRMVREARAIARLSHPNIVKLHEVGRSGDRVFLAMELVRGTTLRRWLRESPRSWAEIVRVMCAAGRGLAAAHAAGLVHRDFKPANVLIDADGRVKVADFGLARSSGAGPSSISVSADEEIETGELADLTETGTVLGTPAYMAPEQHLGDATDPSADQFSFCVSLWEALHGTRPFGGSDRDELISNMMRTRTLPAAGRVPRWLRAAILRGLSPEPERRWPSMEALIRELERRPVVRRWQAMGAFSLAAVAVAAGLGYWQAASGQQRCANVAPQLEGIWDDDARARLRDAVAKIEVAHAASTWQAIESGLDARVDAWSTAFTRACEAGELRGEVSGATHQRSMACLEERRQEVAAVVDALVAADVEVLTAAVDGLAALPAPSRCVRWDREPGAAPPGPARPRAVARVALALGQWARATELVEALRAEGNEPEATLVQAMAAAYRSPGPETIEALWGAIDGAERAARDDLGARGWVAMSELAAMGAPVEDLESVLRMAGHAVRRDGDEPSLDARLTMARAGAALAARRPEDVPELLAPLLRDRADPMARALEARGLLLRGSAHRLAGHPDDAASDHVRALALASDLYGSSHPRVAAFHQQLARTLEASGDRPQAEEHERRAQALLAGRPIPEP